jgi:hypothetical protein
MSAAPQPQIEIFVEKVEKMDATTAAPGAIGIGIHPRQL